MVETLVSSIVQVILFSTVPLIWWLFTARKEQPFLKWIGFKRPILKGSFIKILLSMLVVSGAYIFLMAIVTGQFLEDAETAVTRFEGQGWHALPYILIYAVIQTSLSEEILFRGFIGKRLMNHFGFTVGNTGQAILFGLVHGLPFGLVTGDIVVTLLLTLIPATIGWVEGWLNEKYASGSIIPSWIMHGILNILSAFSSAF